MRVHDAERVEFLRAAPRCDPRRGRGGRRRARLLLLVAARQLRVGLGVREAIRHRASRLRHAGAHASRTAAGSTLASSRRVRSTLTRGRAESQTVAECRQARHERHEHARVGAPPTIEEVAAAAGVSRSTVSRVVNGSTAVSPEALAVGQARDRRAELRAQPRRPLAREPADAWRSRSSCRKTPPGSSATRTSPRSCTGINARLESTPTTCSTCFIASDDPGDKTTQLPAQRQRRRRDRRLAPHQRPLHRPDRDRRAGRLRRSPGARARARLLRRRRQRPRAREAARST